MRILAEDRCTLVFNIFRFYDLAHPGDRLRIFELESRWRHTGLRASDLGTTLLELAVAGLMRTISTPSGPAYFLTEAGACHLRDHPETPETRRALHQLARRPRDSRLMFERRQA